LERLLARSGIGIGFESGDQARGQSVGLHVVDADERALPCDSQPFGRIETGEEVGAHAGAAGDGDKVWKARPRFALWQVLYSMGDEGGEVFLMRLQRDERVHALKDHVV
jgi:hypothetical protein